MRNHSLTEALNLPPEFSGRLVLSFVKGELEHQYRLRPDEFTGTVETFTRTAQKAGYQITLTVKTGE